MRKINGIFLKASGFAQRYPFDAKNTLFTRVKHRNEIYIAFPMLKMPYFRVLSIGMKFTQYFRCSKLEKGAKKASETD